MAAGATASSTKGGEAAALESSSSSGLTLLDGHHSVSTDGVKEIPSSFAQATVTALVQSSSGATSRNTWTGRIAREPAQASFEDRSARISRVEETDTPQLDWHMETSFTAVKMAMWGMASSAIQTHARFLKRADAPLEPAKEGLMGTPIVTAL
ncbi:hypothetical protein cyc_08708 [Cyclospora cayetanensis]|uniref:Uncharacterized protein n=1 Tax=Cyclospora cayetanensis TaxID=88456 RepID=A0A1D3D297_9EIME|nr:hypothetical protein cyc_08708 [Cyclospora cayetanensis]